MNLVFDTKGYLKITDFGISRKFDPLMSDELETYDKRQYGTLGFMAPEILFHKT